MSNDALTKKLKTRIPAPLRAPLRRLFHALCRRHLFHTDDCITNFMYKVVQKGDCVFDIGANVGYYTSLLAEVVGRGEVHAFEANPELIPTLSNIGMASHASASNIKIHNIAVSDTIGKKPFSVDIRKDAAASSLSVLEGLHSAGEVKEIQVECTTLDVFCNLHDLGPMFIKIDVEGHEPSVFRGAHQTIENYRPYIIFEFWEAWWNRGFREVFEYLKPKYELVRLQDGVRVDEIYYNYCSTGVVDIACTLR